MHSLGSLGRAALLGTLAAFATQAQLSPPRPRLVSAGYRTPSPIPVAPGQLVTLFVLGLQVEPAAASGAPLPKELAGVTARIRAPRENYEADLPILDVHPDREDYWDCGESFGCPVAAVTVQIPTEIASSGIFWNDQPIPVLLRSGLLTVSISKDGALADEMQVALVAQNVHALNTCDVGFVRFLPVTGLCFPAVTHADGSLVGGPLPAKPGEVLTLYAVGLGSTAPAVPTGEAAPPEGVALPEGSVGLAYSSEPGEFFVATEPFGGTIEPEYAGLAGGFAGLYQINFRVPETAPPGVAECLAFSSNSNLRIDILTVSSRDSFSICVVP